MREKWKKHVEKFKSLGDKVSGVKGITAIIPAVCLAILMVTVLRQKSMKLQRQKTSVRLRKRLRRKVRQQRQKQRKRIQQRRERRGLLM